MELPNIDENKGVIPHIIEGIVKYGLFIFLFFFSVMAKWFTMIRYRKRMTKFQCVFETLLSGCGGAIMTYAVYEIGVPVWVLCSVGGFGSLVITPLTTVITKESQPTFELVATGVQTFIKKYIKKNT